MSCPNFFLYMNFNTNCNSVKSTEVRFYMMQYKIEMCTNLKLTEEIEMGLLKFIILFWRDFPKRCDIKLFELPHLKRPTQAQFNSNANFGAMVSSFQLEVKINVSKFVQSFTPVFFLCELPFTILWKHILEINESYKTDF